MDNFLTLFEFSATILVVVCLVGPTGSYSMGIWRIEVRSRNSTFSYYNTIHKYIQVLFSYRLLLHPSFYFESSNVLSFPSIALRNFIALLLYYCPGQNAVEIIVTLLLMKLVDPESLYILRGNHESIEMNNNYGFKREVLRKYDLEVFQVPLV